MAQVRIWDDSLNPVSGTNAGETLNGTSGGDYISGGDGNDSLFGKGGNDVLFGGAGDDILDGGEGNDVLIGGAGADTIDVGLGRDLVLYESVLHGGDLVRTNRLEGLRLEAPLGETDRVTVQDPARGVF